MTKLSQHGAFDESVENAVCEELLSEFTESTDSFDFSACQRPDGSVYPIASGAKCRRGTPISVKPGEKHRDIMKKGQRAGLKVRSILEENDRLRAEKGLKRVQGESAIRSLARRLNERMGHGQKPKDVKSVKSVDEAAKAAVKGGAKIADKKPSQQINKRFLQERSTQKLQAYLNDRKLYPYQRKAIEDELKRRAQGGNASAKPQKPQSAKAAKPVGLDKDYGVVVNKKLLAQDTAILQRILRERSLNPRQRAKIEEEVGARGETPASYKRAPKAAAGANLPKKGGLKVTEVVSGYDAVKAYNDPTNVKLGSGCCGTAYRTKGPPPGIVKQGKIGEFEVEAWQRLQGTGRVPEIYGAAVSQNYKRIESGLGGHVRESKGYLGLGIAKGESVRNIFLTGSARAEMVNEYIRSRRDLHTKGVAHNDMHGGNVYYDVKTGKMQIIDFGLAQVSYKAALMEALSTNKGDWQSGGFLGRYVDDSNAPPAVYAKFLQNQSRTLSALEKAGVNTRHLTRMGIRNRPDDIDRVLLSMSESEAKGYLKALYEGI